MVQWLQPLHDNQIKKHFFAYSLSSVQAPLGSAHHS